MKQVKISSNQLMEAAIIFYLLTIMISVSTSSVFVKISRVLLVVVFLLYVILAGRLILIRSGYLIWAVVFFAYCSFGVLWSTYPEATRSQVQTLAYVFIADIIILYYLYRNPARVRVILDVLILGSILSNFYVYTMNGFTAFLQADTLSDGTNSNLYGLHSAFSVTLSIIQMRSLEKKQSLRRWRYVLSIFLSIIFVVLSGSRKAYLYFLIPIGVLVIFQSKSPVKVLRRILLVVIALFLVYCAVMFIPPIYQLIGESLQSMIDGLMGRKTDASVSSRMYFIQFGMKKFKIKPLLGYGLDGFSYLYKEISYSGTGHYAHNNYVELLVDCGLLGTIIYYFMPILALIRLIRHWVMGKSTELTATFIGLLIAILICDYGQVSYYLPYIQLILLLCYLLSEDKIQNNLFVQQCYTNKNCIS